MVQQLANYFHRGGKLPSELGNVPEGIRTAVAKAWAEAEVDREARLDIYHAAGLKDEIISIAQSTLSELQPDNPQTPFDLATYQLAKRSIGFAGDPELSRRLANTVLSLVSRAENDSEYLFEEAGQILSGEDHRELFNTAVKTAEAKVAKPEEALRWYQKALETANTSSQDSGEQWAKLGRLAIDFRTAGIGVNYQVLETVHNRVNDGEVSAALEYLMDESVREREDYFNGHLTQAMQRLDFHPISSTHRSIKDLERLVRKGGAPFTSNDYAALKDGRYVVVRFPSADDGELAVYSISPGNVTTALNGNRPLRVQPEHREKEAFTYVMAQLRAQNLFW